MSDIRLNTIDEALEDIRLGKVVIVVDDEDRENEGDFIVAAEKITPEIVNFMATHGRGLICAPLPESRCEELELDLMVGKNTAVYETPFTVSVDLIGSGCTTGISASDRAKTIRALVDPATSPIDLGRPGHIFPLKARERGVIRRAGHTEAVVDLTRMAGLTPGGALVEIMSEDGTMARLPQLMEIAKRFGLKIIAIKDLIAYRLKSDSIVDRGETVHLPTQYGDFKLTVFRQKSNGQEHVAIVKGEWTSNDIVLVRVHSSCMTGDIFGSCRCDCGSQLHEALRMIEKEGCGAIVYLNQEGRGIGLFNKIHAYKLQEEGKDTVEANIELGFQADERDYGVGASILHEIKVRKARLMTNNPLKRKGLEGYGIEIIGNVPIIISPNLYNRGYLSTKENKMGHTLGLKQDKK
ncbi:MAG: bifunctional 3,4-dihydroxy-2-butanone-4-phosphate synthase/GTP cyclohydrolase II [Prevotellaceae bacterium]|jgi:3,4-dihydroxy 2-butanone 4-phosphate synthase/GTP cyclohydrolase II|nr:bifunctional 3,4-dihydroxy-2-butanone-4-phosphate synthase/GTP cyclohydrolase II [Prevotellaceae bacterium]